MNFRKTLILCIIIGGIVPSLKAGYYQSNLFPIGLTGINPSGSNCPYSSANADPPWAWTPDYSSNNEQDLIFNLGINCIGCQDAKPNYLIDWSDGNASNYLTEVCMQSPDTARVYLITAGYYVEKPRVQKCALDTAYDTTVNDSFYEEYIYCLVDCDTFSFDWIDSTNVGYINSTASELFRSPYRGKSPGIGSMRFSACPEGGEWDCHGTKVDNWDDCDYDTTWQNVADSAVEGFKVYFDSNSGHAKYVWGFNLITEDPAVYRNKKGDPPWRGCWAAVDRIFRGYNTGFSFPGQNKAGHAGFRGRFEAACFGDTNRMIVAKSQFIGLMYGNGSESYDIFESLPDLDAFISYMIGYFKAEYNYGQQDIFDGFLYYTGSNPEYPALTKLGYHNTAVYFQKYAGNNKAYSDQRRRWFGCIGIGWSGVSEDGSTATSRRPCPPELRCACYLTLSRGAKGIFFHPWTSKTSNAICPEVQIPPVSTSGGDKYAGMRDPNGYPFGYPGHCSNHYLNDGSNPLSPYSRTYWHDSTTDYTYKYLGDTLIPELKAVGKVLVHLDWVNAYSLASTVTGKSSPCPHMYVADVSGAEYVDVGFFKHEDDGVDYFMVVNREGIAEMKNRRLKITIAGWDVDYIKVVDMRSNISKILERDRRGWYVFTEMFEPGEGRLYQVTKLDGSTLPALG